MALVDSVASFEKRCKELQDGLHETMIGSGIDLRVINVLEKLFFKIFFFMILIWFCYDFVMFCSWLIL